MKTRLGIIFASLGFVTFASTGQASDIADLDKDQPTQLEDATPTAWGELQAELSSIYSKTEDDRFELGPSLDWGVLKGMRIQAAVLVIPISGDRVGSGDIEFDALYLIPSEEIWSPDIAIGVVAALPTGIESRGIDSEFKLIVSQDLKGGKWRQRAHFNFSWLRNDQPREDERGTGYRVALGYQLIPNDRTSLVADLVRRTERRANEESNMIEGGALISVSDDATVGVSLGWGFGDESPDLEARASVQVGI